MLCRGSALRFMLTRLVDWLNVPPGALVKPKDPLEYDRKLAFHRHVRHASEYGLERMSGGRVTLYTDGACSGNPGPGGWGAILIFNGAEKELSGGEAMTTNNRMEMTAAIEGLNALKRPCAVDLYTDSQYLMQGITAWMRNWKRRGWRTADNKPVKNEELWRALDEAASRHEVKWHWVRGHADDPLNNRVDALAVAAMQPFRKARQAAPSAPGATARAPRRAERRRAERSTRRGRAEGPPSDLAAIAAHRDLSRFSAPEMSALPGPSSMLIAATTPSSTTME